MGGDRGPSVVIRGADIALKRNPGLKFILFGREEEFGEWLERFPDVAKASQSVHCEIAVRMDEKASQALRRGRRESSMWRTIDAVKNKQADVAVSAGNTGALMAMAFFNLRTMPGVDRPALAGKWPTSRGDSIVLDMGASIGANQEQLVDFAVMGAAMARAILGVRKPTIGLLNIGVEEVKGLEQVKQAGAVLRELEGIPFSYHGFVEGNDLGQGTTDVVVTEGFSGNIALKAAEGTARQITGFLKRAMIKSWRTRLGYMLARPAFDALKEKLDPAGVNGGVFLGLNGLVIKSHGGTSPIGFASAIETGVDMARFDLVAKIARDIDLAHRTDTLSAGKSEEKAIKS